MSKYTYGSPLVAVVRNFCCSSRSSCRPATPRWGGLRPSPLPHLRFRMWRSHGRLGIPGKRRFRRVISVVSVDLSWQPSPKNHPSYGLDWVYIPRKMVGWWQPGLTTFSISSNLIRRCGFEIARPDQPLAGVGSGCFEALTFCCDRNCNYCIGYDSKIKTPGHQSTIRWNSLRLFGASWNHNPIIRRHLLGSIAAIGSIDRTPSSKTNMEHGNPSGRTQCQKISLLATPFSGFRVFFWHGSVYTVAFFACGTIQL